MDKIDDSRITLGILSLLVGAYAALTWWNAADEIQIIKAYLLALIAAVFFTGALITQALGAFRERES